MILNMIKNKILIFLLGMLSMYSLLIFGNVWFSYVDSSTALYTPVQGNFVAAIYGFQIVDNLAYPCDEFIYDKILQPAICSKYSKKPQFQIRNNETCTTPKSTDKTDLYLYNSSNIRSGLGLTIERMSCADGSNYYKYTDALTNETLSINIIDSDFDLSTIITKDMHDKSNTLSLSSPYLFTAPFQSYYLSAFSIGR